jgi:hypothetical protein
MIQCQDCGWQLSVDSRSKPCPACGGVNQLILSADMAIAGESSPPLLLRSYHFAPEWFHDALTEARHPVSNRSSKRREIIFAVCCVEAYLLEWAYHQVLGQDANQLVTYFPQGKSPGICERLKNVANQLHSNGLLPNKPDFGGLNEWSTLVNFRNGLVHASASRPESNVPSDPMPTPSLNDLDQMSNGWAVRVITKVIGRLHSAAGTPTPSWLVPV